MEYLLHIESSTTLCSICISEKDQLLSIKESANNDHASRISLLIQDCCQEAGIKLSQLKAVSVSSGPGSYTSLRIGTSAAKGICYALNLPLIAVDTLKALALAANEYKPNADFYAPMIDARRMDVYSSLYDNTLNNIAETDHFTLSENTFNAIFNSGKYVVICGNANEKCKGVIRLPLALYSDIFPSARLLVSLAWQAYLDSSFEDVAYYSPNYFKAPNITTPKGIL